MNTGNKYTRDPSDDLLDRAIQAMLVQPAPQDIKQRVIEAAAAWREIATARSTQQDREPSIPARSTSEHPGTARPVPPPVSNFRGRLRSWLPTALVTAVAAMAIATGLRVTYLCIAPRPAYAVEGLRERLLKIRSLHVTGWSYHTIEVDGKKSRQEFPFEYYIERPSRRWNTWHGFHPDRVESGFYVLDESRLLRVSHTEKSATLTEAIPLLVELGVESALQNHSASRLVEGAATDYRLIGREDVNGVRALRYESIREKFGDRDRNVVWLHPETGLPVRSAFYVGPEGREQLSQINDRIETNVPPSPGMFSFEAPEGYTLKQVKRSPTEPFVGPSAGGGGRHSGVRHTFAIDNRAILVCWMNQPRPPGAADRPAVENDVLMMNMELTGSPENRRCQWYPVRNQRDQDFVWHWSLVVPEDARPLNSSEELSIVFKTRFSEMSSNPYPLYFEDGRLAKLLLRLQTETFSEQSADEAPFTLADLRQQLARVLAEPADPEKPSETPP
jgi:hypothetical protein